MADNVAVTAGSGTTIAADEVTDGTLGTVKVQYVKIMDGTLDGTSKATVNANGLLVDTADDYTRQLGRVKLADDSGAIIEPVGQVAHDAADGSGTRNYPTKMGRKARDGLSDITLVSEDDVTDAYGGLDSVQAVRPHALLGDIVSEVDTNTDGASTAFASGLAAPGAGIRICVTDVTLVNSSSSDITVDLRDGAAGSVIWTFPVPANGGVTHSFGVPLKLTANTALAYDASAATTTLTICAAGFLTKL